MFLAPFTSLSITKLHFSHLYVNIHLIRNFLLLVVKNPLLEYYGIGMLRYWNVTILECYDIGMLRSWYVHVTTMKIYNNCKKLNLALLRMLNWTID